MDFGEDTDEWASRWKKRFRRRVLGIALFHYLVWLGFGGILFVFAALPVGGAVDWLILPLTDFRGWIGFPRNLLRSLWPSETTPWLLNHVITLLTSLSWGVAYASWKYFRLDGPLLRSRKAD
ncbi:MAG: hypothetical protein ACKVHO_11705 [Verrucomicrobiia bacterium]|jgi:hypothetical protein